MYYTGTSKFTHLHDCTIIFQQKRCLSEKTKISEIKCPSSINKEFIELPIFVSFQKKNCKEKYIGSDTVYKPNW